MKRGCGLVALGLFMAVSGLSYGISFVDRAETRLGFQTGFFVSPESADVSLSIASFNYHLEGFHFGSDWLKFRLNYGFDSERYAFSVNALLPLLSLGMLFGAAPFGYDSTFFTVLKNTLWAINLPMVLANGYASVDLFGGPLSLDLISEGDLLYSTDGSFRYEESIAAGVSLDLDKQICLRASVRMLFFSNGFYFDAEHLSAGVSLGYQI